MPIDAVKIRERLASQFPDAVVDDTVVRFTRKAGDTPFAVYYLDLAEDLPRNLEELTKYQDRVIGQYYFEGERSLQWNNYLYFVTSADRLASHELDEPKLIVESDRTYARKFVIADQALDSALVPSVVVPRTDTPQANVLSRWTERLMVAGLDEAILSDEDMPTRLMRIEKTAAGRAVRRAVSGRADRALSPQFIDSLHLKEYREFPRRKDFEFGAANLIVGANGTGKTLLLEAIELFYCGRNKRNPDATPEYEIVAILPDGKAQTATRARPLQEFRDCNLWWYGQSEVRTNYLYRSFAQFNFLDTDAAVTLAMDEGSADRLKTGLSSLLVGPDASKVWHDIQRVGKAVAEKLRDLTPRESQIRDELATLDQRIREAREVPRDSDSVRARLNEMIVRIGWTSARIEKGESPSQLMEHLSELIVLAESAAALRWIRSPVSIEELVGYCREARATIAKSEPVLAQLYRLQESRKLVQEAFSRDREALDLARQLQRLIDAGVPRMVQEHGELQRSLEVQSGQVAGLDADEVAVLPEANLDLTVAAFVESSELSRSKAEASLASAVAEHSKLSKMQAESASLAQQLRQIATAVIRYNNKPDECPLCHTQFGPSELAARFILDVDKKAEATSQMLLAEVRELEGLVSKTTSVQATAVWIKDYCARSGLPLDSTLRTTLASVEHTTRALTECRDRILVLERRLALLALQGLSVARLEEISTRLRALRYPVDDLSGKAVDLLIKAVEGSLSTSSCTLEAESDQTAKIQRELAEAVGASDPSVQGIGAAVSELNERLVTTESLRSRLESLARSLPWHSGRPLAELVVEAGSVRKVAVALQAAIGLERQATSTDSESTIRQEDLQRQLDQLLPRIGRFREAQSALEGIQNELSLDVAMAKALQENREGVEAIFSRIHSPAEFSGLGTSLTTVLRGPDGLAANLTEISAGQRAALALSIFLAQNAQLAAAPPVMLFDDPIAHVDDLNCLSFLDYLREVVLGGGRQIFFATADNKLASLFERKFDFLGTKAFRRIDLRR